MKTYRYSFPLNLFYCFYLPFFKFIQQILNLNLNIHILLKVHSAFPSFPSFFLTYLLFPLSFFPFHFPSSLTFFCTVLSLQYFIPVLRTLYFNNFYVPPSFSIPSSHFVSFPSTFISPHPFNPPLGTSSFAFTHVSLHLYKRTAF